MVDMQRRDSQQRIAWKIIGLLARDAAVEIKRLPDDGGYRERAIIEACFEIEEQLVTLRSLCDSGTTQGA